MSNKKRSTPETLAADTHPVDRAGDPIDITAHAVPRDNQVQQTPRDEEAGDPTAGRPACSNEPAGCTTRLPARCTHPETGAKLCPPCAMEVNRRAGGELVPVS